MNLLVAPCLAIIEATLDNFLSPLVRNEQVVGKGFGSFAIAAIPRRTVIATFGGTPARRDELSRFHPDRVSRSIQVDTDLFFVGPTQREPGDSINHSCEPNCFMRNATQIATLRNIEAGEELTFDYAMSDASDYDEFECVCGSPKCRGMIRGDDWKRLDLQERYVNGFSPYIARKIDALKIARKLNKREVEQMLNDYDRDPSQALVVALRIVIGRSFATWRSAIDEICDGDPRAAGLIAFERGALDELAKELNENRVARL